MWLRLKILIILIVWQFHSQRNTHAVVFHWTRLLLSLRWSHNSLAIIDIELFLIVSDKLGRIIAIYLFNWLRIIRCDVTITLQMFTVLAQLQRWQKYIFSVTWWFSCELHVTLLTNHATALTNISIACWFWCLEEKRQSIKLSGIYQTNSRIQSLELKWISLSFDENGLIGHWCFLVRKIR